MSEHITLITDQSGLELIGIGGYAEGGDMDEPVTVPERLRELAEAASEGPWSWLDGEDEGDELQDGHGEMVATGFRENIVFDGKPLNRDGSFAAAAVNFVRSIPPGYVLVPGDERDALLRRAEAAEADWQAGEAALVAAKDELDMAADRFDAIFGAIRPGTLSEDTVHGITQNAYFGAEHARNAATLLQERKAGQ